MTPSILTTESLTRDGSFAALRDHIVSATGLCFYAHRPETLAIHIVDRLAKHGLDDCEDYLRLLQDQRVGEEELDQLIELLTIGETYFFRHREAFDALRDNVLPEIIRRNHSTKRLRIWSAGCSIGAEPYSTSILLRQDLAHLTHDWSISILGTDINRRFLAQATEGRFENWAFRGTPNQLRQTCFTKHGNQWLIDPQYRTGVAFQYHNLARHPIPSLVHNLSAFDLILCRNVLIYFGPEVIEQLVNRMFDCLVPGGWLVVGHAEYNTSLFRAFETINCHGAVLYRKPGDTFRTVPFAPEYIPPRWVGLDKSDESRISQQDRISALGFSPEHVAKDSAGSPEAETELASIRSLADEGNMEAGLARCQELVRSDPLNATYHFYHALLLDQLGEHPQAVAALRRTIYLDRDFVLAHYYLGLTWQKQGHAKEATSAYGNVLDLLSKREESECLPHAEGLTVADLVDLTQMHLDTLGNL